MMDRRALGPFSAGGASSLGVADDILNAQRETPVSGGCWPGCSFGDDAIRCLASFGGVDGTAFRAT